MYHIIIQHAADKKLAPTTALLRKWAEHTLAKQALANAQVTIRLVDVAEMTVLNTTYRNKKGPTNVLSFPFGLPEEVKMEIPILGDIIICSEVVNQEASSQQKSQQAHFAHMVIHGILHLLGYDHETDAEAKVMESLEKKVMQTLGFPNPYRD